MAGTAFNTANWDGYDEAPATNPGSALTDFTLLIDISTLSADWKAAVQSDAGDIRCTKGDDTEIPLDVINFAYNAGAPTGFIRVLWSATLASSGTQNLRVYVGHGTAVAYDANETYGSDNAYDEYWEAYIPMQEDAKDRTSHSNDFTAQGSITIGGATGQFGDATTFDGSDDALTRADAVCSAEPFTFMCWANDDTTGDVIIGINNSGDPDDGWALYKHSSGGNKVSAMAVDDDGPTYAYGKSTDSMPASGWFHAAAVFASDTSRTGYMNAVPGSADTTSVTANPAADPETAIGRTPRYDSADYVGDLQDAQIHSTDRATAWIAEEYAQSNDQPAFWGVWAWTAASGTIARQVISAYRRTR